MLISDKTQAISHNNKSFWSRLGSSISQGAFVSATVHLGVHIFLKMESNSAFVEHSISIELMGF